ncbi:MAG: thiamine phosphate synthase [Pseudomonadota bacterium]
MNRDFLRLYGISDGADLETGNDASRAALVDAAQGGMTLYQLRCKRSDGATLVERAMEARQILAPRGVPVLVNDRADVAVAAGTDGVHLGQDDIPPDAARRILGPDPILGVTIRTEAEAQATPLDGVDYVAIGGVYTTSSKANETPPVGLDGLAALVRAVKARKPGMPIVAIAGITADNAADVCKAGADGVSVISALFGAADVRLAARDLRRSVELGLQERTVK